MFYLCLLLGVTATFGQREKVDSAAFKRRDSIKLGELNKQLEAEIKSIRRELKECSDFQIAEVPEWAEKNLAPKSFYQNCRSGGSTPVVLNKDSTFLYKWGGEGPYIYLQKGKWSIRNSDTLVLKGIASLVPSFKKKIKNFEDRTSRSKDPFEKVFLYQPSKLIEVDE